MGIQIRVAPDVLRQEADEIQIVVNQNDALCDQIKVLANKLDDAWDSLSSKDMVDKLLVLSKYSNSISEHLVESMQFLQVVAEQFEQIDNGSDNTFSVAFKMDSVITMIGSRPDFLQPIKLSSDTIRVVPDELREVANESKEIMNRSDDLTNNLEKIINKLQGSWEGRAYSRFSEKFNEVKDFYLKLTESLEEFSQKIIFVADRYEQIDNLFG